MIKQPLLQTVAWILFLLSATPSLNAQEYKVLVINPHYSGAGSPEYDFDLVDTKFDDARVLWNLYSHGKSTAPRTQVVVPLNHDKGYYTDRNTGVLMFDALEEAPAYLPTGMTLADYDIHVFMHGITPGNNGLPGNKVLFSDPIEELRVNHILHEYLHSFGIRHSNAWKTGSDSPYSRTGFSYEYGHQYCTLGSFSWNEATNINVRVKDRMGWLDNWVDTVDSDGTFTKTLVASDDPSSGPGVRALRIRGDDRYNYWIEFRQDQGLDITTGVRNGVLIAWGFNNWRYLDPDSGNLFDQQILQLDMTPNSEPDSLEKDFMDGALEVQSPPTTTDPGNITIDPISIDDSAAIPEITLSITVPTGHVTQIDQPANVDIYSPNGTLALIDASTPYTFYAKAVDPDVGAIDGDGIERVVFKFFGIGDGARAPIYTCVSENPPWACTVDFTLPEWQAFAEYDQGFNVVARSLSDMTPPSSEQYWNEDGTFFLLDFPGN